MPDMSRNMLQRRTQCLPPAVASVRRHALQHQQRRLSTPQHNILTGLGARLANMSGEALFAKTAKYAAGQGRAGAGGRRCPDRARFHLVRHLCDSQQPLTPAPSSARPPPLRSVQNAVALINALPANKLPKLLQRIVAKLHIPVRVIGRWHQHTAAAPALCASACRLLLPAAGCGWLLLPACG